MKILSAQQIKAADAFTIVNEPIASIDLMERAATAFCEKLFTIANVHQTHIAIIAGTGNNGGDGLAIARLLHLSGAIPKVYVVGDSQKSTADFQTNLNRLAATGVSYVWVDDHEKLNEAESCCIIIDALFGTGLSRSARGIYQSVIETINRFQKTTFSVDVPSGLFCDGPNHEGDSIVKATHTITFQQPKLSFFIAESGKYCGQIHVADIGLSRRFIANTETDFFTVEKKDIRSLPVFKREKFTHKGTYGHLLLAAGSYGKAGAAVLSAKAALRSGAGLVSVQSPAGVVSVLQTAVPEAMCLPNTLHEYITAIEAPFADAYAIGPGMGTHIATSECLLSFLKQNQKPVVLDADALNILSKQKNLRPYLGENTVITPHPKEFDRLAGVSAHGFERLEKARLFAQKYGVVVVLKGAYTAVIHPSGKTYYNTTGNPGMATAGSGDVLTGIIGAFLAQGLKCFEAALAGVYLHGLAGDRAAIQKTEMCMVAGDLVQFLPEAVKQITTT